MSTSRYQLSLLLFGCLSASTLLISRPVLAQSVTESELEAVEVSSNNHSCYEQTDEQPIPLGELRQAMLETVEVMARASDSVQEQVGSLLNLSRYYACRGQMTKAESLLAESLEIANEIDDSQIKVNLLSQIIGAYGQSKSYGTIRNIVDMQEDESDRELLIESPIYVLHYEAEEEEQAQIEALFPELISILNERNEQQWEMDPEASPVEMWVYTLAGNFYGLPDANRTEDLASLISEQIDVVENFPDPYSQSYGYAILGTYAWENGDEVQARSLIETAVQKVEGLEETDQSELSLAQLGGYSLNTFLGMALIHVGEYERGVSLIRNTEEYSAPFAKVELLLSAVIRLSDAEQFELAAEVASDAEAEARISGEVGYFLGEVALAYFQSGQINQGQRIIQELLDLANTESEAVSHYRLSVLATQLMRLGQVSTAEEIAQKVTSPALKISVLGSIAHAYYYGDYSGNSSEEDKVRSFSLSSQALDIAQQASFEDYINNNTLLNAVTGETDSATTSSESNELEWRYTLINQVLSAAPTPEIRQELIEQITNETLQNRVAQRLSEMNERMPNEVEMSADQTLRTEAINAAKAGNFQQAIDILSQIESSTVQIRALLNIAKCYVSNETSLDEPTRLSLEALQQQYQ